MPRFDPTFTSDDIIRLYLNALTRDEQERVEEFFEAQNIDVFREIRELILGVAGLIPLVGELAEVLRVIFDLVDLERVTRLNSERDRTIQRLRRRSPVAP